MAVRHLKLVVAYVLVGLVLTAALLSGREHSPKPLHHSAAAAAANRVHAQYVLLHAVLGVSAACLLFSSTGFALAGLILFAQQEKAARAGLHYSDSPPQADARARERRETAVHTLVAANGAVCLLWLACGWSLEHLRWALPPLPAWVITCGALLCASNLATGGMLAAKHSRWAPWLLPGHSSIPLNEPSRLVSLFEQLRAKAFGRRPGLPKAQKGCGVRRVRRSASSDRLPLLAEGLTPSPLTAALGPTADLESAQVIVPGPATGASSNSQSSTWAVTLDDSSFHTPPPRGISRTYSEDEEVDLSASSVSSRGSSVDVECGQVFMDVLQANILSHPDDTLQFLHKLSPERCADATASPAPTPRLFSLPGLFGVGGSKAQPMSLSPATPQQLAGSSQALSPLTPLTFCSPLSGGSDSFAERKRAMTRVSTTSATIEELLGSVVGELV